MSNAKQQKLIQSRMTYLEGRMKWHAFDKNIPALTYARMEYRDLQEKLLKLRKEAGYATL